MMLLCQKWKIGISISKRKDKNMGKYRFTAKECTFEGTSGYMVTQYREDGTIATEGFTPSDEYETFCKSIGVVPELITEE